MMFCFFLEKNNKTLQKLNMEGMGIEIYFDPPPTKDENTFLFYSWIDKKKKYSQKKYSFFVNDRENNEKKMVSCENIDQYINQQIIVIKRVKFMSVRRLAKIFSVKKDVAVFLTYRQKGHYRKNKAVSLKCDEIE